MRGPATPTPLPRSQPTITDHAHTRAIAKPQVNNGTAIKTPSGIANITYGRGYADSFPNSRFVPIPDAGHFPQIEQIEQLGQTLEAIGDFVDTVVKPGLAD